MSSAAIEIASDRRKRVDLTTSVVIATGDRPEPLRETLLTLAAQTVPPGEIIVIDGSHDDATRTMLEEIKEALPIDCLYRRAGQRGAAVQRNEGAALAGGDIVFFLDDDVALEPNYLEEILHVFRNDAPGEIGGVMGCIVNQTYGRPGRITRMFYRLMAGRNQPTYAGQLLGPAVNILPEDRPDSVQDVEWLPSTAVAYRKAVFDRHRFGTFFTGYSFAEDVHLSARVRKTHRLVHTTRARLFHKDLGGATHRNWVDLGRMQTVNRWIVMRDVLERRHPADRLRFLAAQAFFLATDLRSALKGQARQLLPLAAGRILGCVQIAVGAAKASRMAGRSD